MRPAAKTLARLLPMLAALAPLSGAALGQDEPPLRDRLENDDVAFSPEIWSSPDPSLLAIRGRCLPTGELYRLVVEYETDGAARYRALLIYAEPSHRLLFLQWNGPPDERERMSIVEKPLSFFEEDSQRRFATFGFRPEHDDRLLVEAITPWNERVEVLSGRVASLCDFAVQNRVHD